VMRVNNDGEEEQKNETEVTNEDTS